MGYIGAGIGLYMTDSEMDASYSGPYNSQLEELTDQADFSDSGKCFGFHLVAGADYAVAPNFSVGAELKYSKANQEIETSNDGTKDYNVGGTSFNVIGKMLF